MAREEPAGGIVLTSAKGYLPAPVVERTFVRRRRSLLPETYFQADESLGSGPLADIDRTTIDTFLFPLGKGKVLPHRRIDLVDRLASVRGRTGAGKKEKEIATFNITLESISSPLSRRQGRDFYWQQESFP